MQSFRFIHAADIHLDSPMRGLSDHVSGISEQLRLATRDAFTRLVDAAVARAIDFLLIAGDVYDGDWRDYQTGIFFVAQMKRLQAADIPVYLIHGNHDAVNRMTRQLTLPDNVHVFSSGEAETATLDTLSVALHGMSYAEQAVVDNLVPGYPEPVSGHFNIGLLHTGLGGMGDHENYAPCSVEELTAKGYDYWALGHVHSARVLAEYPHVAFSGNLQGRSIRETGAKSVWEVSVDAGRVSAMQPIYCDVARWQQLTLDMTDAAELSDVPMQIQQAIEAAAGTHDDRLLALRLTLTGTTVLHDSLLADAPSLLAEARAGAAGIGHRSVYVEKITLKTVPATDARTHRQRQDALGEIQRILAEAEEHSDLREMIQKDVHKLIRGLPSDIRHNADDELLRAALDGDLEQLIRGASAYLMARLNAEEPSA